MCGDDAWDWGGKPGWGELKLSRRFSWEGLCDGLGIVVRNYILSRLIPPSTASDLYPSLWLWPVRPSSYTHPPPLPPSFFSKGREFDKICPNHHQPVCYAWFRNGTILLHPTMPYRAAEHEKHMSRMGSWRFPCSIRREFIVIVLSATRTCPGEVLRTERPKNERTYFLDFWVTVRQEITVHIHDV